ncbi:unnamed protein product [Nesidiocoris tenuis]|uniref:Uncharacterized protein n=1 Tax=Nesidiocoris tenuis TaxID=355587 RepID=A0A6H5G522_9HEMI|nr:unnamed protein product [Nesidiocoris tenuis]
MASTLLNLLGQSTSTILQFQTTEVGMRVISILLPQYLGDTKLLNEYAPFGCAVMELCAVLVYSTIIKDCTFCVLPPGYGIYVNSSDGGVHIEGGHVAENGADGIRYVGHEFRLKDRKNVFDLCTLPTTSSQTFPLLIEMHQSLYSAQRKDCDKIRSMRPFLTTWGSLRLPEPTFCCWERNRTLVGKRVHRSKRPSLGARGSLRASEVALDVMARLESPQASELCVLWFLRVSFVIVRSKPVETTELGCFRRVYSSLNIKQLLAPTLYLGPQCLASPNAGLFARKRPCPLRTTKSRFGQPEFAPSHQKRPHQANLMTSQALGSPTPGSSGFGSTNEPIFQQLDRRILISEPLKCERKPVDDHNTSIYSVNMEVKSIKLKAGIASRNFEPNRLKTKIFRISLWTTTILPFTDRMSKRLIPRSRVAAAIVISSDNTVVFRNIIQNPQSLYEIGVHLQDQSKSVNCTFNWLGFSDEDRIYYRLFDRYDDLLSSPMRHIVATKWSI